MPSIISRQVSEHWQQLQQRERRVIVAGVIVVALVGLGFMLNHFFQIKQELNQQQQDIAIKLEWMLEQAEINSSLASSCVGSIGDNASVADPAARQDLLSSLANIYQLELMSLDFRNDEYTVLVNSDNGNNILRFAHECACKGFELTNLSIENIGEDQEFYTGELELVFF